MPKIFSEATRIGFVLLLSISAQAITSTAWGQEPENPRMVTPPAAQKPPQKQNAWEIYRLGKIHAAGIGVTKDAVKARAYFEQALTISDRKVARAAAFALGRLALEEFHDPRLAATAFQKGAELGDAWSVYSLAKLYRPESGPLADAEKAKTYYQQALASEDPAVAKAAAFDLGQFALKDLKDPGLAVHAFEKGVALNDGWSSYRLAEIYASGDAVPRDLPQARRYFEQAMADPDKNVAKAAAFALGQLALNDLKDRKLAVDTLRRGVALGDPWAMFLLAQTLQAGKRAERAEARTLYSQAVSGSNDTDLSKAALFALAELYLKSPGRNTAQALRYHQEAAKLGNDWSTFAIAGLYAQGNGIKKSSRTARDYYARALQSKDPAVAGSAAFALGQLHLRKPLLNPKRAAEYFTRGSELGDVWSTFALAELRANGRGVKRSASRAKALYETVRLGGDPAAANAASFALGQLHRRGPLRNLRLAERYFKFGADRQDMWSTYFLAELYLDKAQAKKARVLIRLMRQSDDPQVRLAATSLMKRLKR